ncbi:MAG: serine--tRNA ligase [Candidatus Omnitrophica bacterium]|nr:serine--tRNA ligase [Candidatus Omnitrophota bacterium]
MLDIRWIRENREKVEASLKNRGASFDLEGLLSLDEERRRLLQEVEALKHERNVASDEIGLLLREKKDTTSKKEEMKAISQKIASLDEKVGEISKKLDYLVLIIPNIPHSSVPLGEDSRANKEVRSWGKPRKFSFKPKTHLELLEHLGIIDFKRGAKVTGAAFPLYVGDGAKLERSLIQFMLELHTGKHGYQEISPPFLVNRESMTGTGQIPKFEEDMYRLKDDDYFLVPTAEVPVTNLHRDEVLEEKELPLYYTAYTPCFRREAGSYGKETKGLTRVHQFDKVELVKFTHPDKSYEEHEKLLKDAEEVLQLLEIPYRVMLLSTGDLGFAASKCYDIEAYAAGTGTYLEVSSCSNFEAFQARRANIRFRSKSTKASQFVHTLNGSGVALARTVICLLEHFQEEDGSVLLPMALRPYMGGQERLTTPPR